MLHIIRSALVPYSTEKMFTLVNNISAYPEFLPGCNAIRVLKQNGSALITEINVSKAGISKSFTTHNMFTINKSIVICLVEGPFSYFAANWFFIPLSNEVSKVDFHLDFAFKNQFIELAFGDVSKK
ncbi:Ribosome association toxin RatA [Sodalis endosymbiont of Henestaris halophilus]|nr:Ribosome association toxin RatA [Sodalis endosymbiont of Henestaris halophilus]